MRMSNLFELYSKPENCLIKPISLERYKISLEIWINIIGDKKITNINHNDIRKFISSRRLKYSNVSDATIRRDISCLSSLLNFACFKGYISNNPIKSFVIGKQLKAPKKVIRYLSYEEKKVLISVSPSPLKEMIIFAIETGARKSEELNLTWQDVDFANKEIVFNKTKNGEKRIVPLTPKLYSLLWEQKKSNSDFVFSNSGKAYKSVSGTFYRAMKKANINNFRWHDLRHTFATYAVKGMHQWQTKPMNLYHVQKWLGHKSPTMTQRYAHLSIDDLHKEITISYPHIKCGYHRPKP